MKRFILICVISLFGSALYAASPIKGLLERIDKGAFSKFIIQKVPDSEDYFELSTSPNGRVVVKGNNYVSIACGINWYLKYYAHVHLSWNCMQAKLPDTLPAVPRPERHSTKLQYRYYLNYCTYSYSMAFWDWKRWEQEIDWMALHGVNLPLAIVGTDVVWKNVLTKLGYSRSEINNFIAGPAFQAWWLMNNLEGWGGPNPDSWYAQREALQKQILKRMHEYGIHPVLPGYSGMVPHDARQRLGLDVANPGKWCGYQRPAFLQPTDNNFGRIAELYYKELTRLYGKADYYSMDPFHEGGSVSGVDLPAAGRAILTAMKKENPKAVWVAQAWGNCPYPAMIKGLPKGDLLVLDLFSESRPQWGDPASSWYRKDGFNGHDWVYCMLLNFGGNVGLHGKMQHVIEEFYKARGSAFNSTLKGVGMTMEGIENNPVMYELLCELPWRSQSFSKDDWLKKYTEARYGKSNRYADEAWALLSNSIYNCPAASTQQGTHESILCARPSLKVYQVSSWSEMQDYYNPWEVVAAAGKMVKAATDLKGNNNFEYDLVDIVRQAVAELARLEYPKVVAAYKAKELADFRTESRKFLNLILLQDRLLATRAEFKVGKWITDARALGGTPEEKDWLEWNARVQITTWGNRAAADGGGLRDYAHKEWNGLLRDFYYMRWKTYFDELEKELQGATPHSIDFYALEEPWTLKHNAYAAQAEGDPVTTARDILMKALRVQAD